MDSVVQNANGTLSFTFGGYGNALFIPTWGLTGFMRSNQTGYGNLTLLMNARQCTLETCDLTLAPIEYVPSLGGNVFFALLFGILLVINAFLGIRYKTIGYTVALLLGLFGEVVGYAGRILLHQSPFDPTGNNFLIYLAPLTIAPAFLSAAIYLCLSRIVVVYGEDKSRIPARYYIWIFCFADLLSLVLQALGGGLASTAKKQSSSQLGVNIMLAGLSSQVVSLVIFGWMCIDFAIRVKRSGENSSHQQSSPSSLASALASKTRFKCFLVSIAVAATAILIRSIFRIAELSEGFHGHLANDQVTFFLLESTMIAIASLCLTAFHPGSCFRGFWDDCYFNLFKKQSKEVAS